MPVGAAIGAVVGGVAQASAARKAARAQENAANRDIEFQRETRDVIRNDLAPYRNTGTTAIQAYRSMFGLGEAPMIGGTPLEIETVPGATTAPTGVGQPRQGDSLWPTVGRVNAVIRRFGGTENWLATPGETTPTRYRVGGQMFDTMEDAQAYANANRTGGERWSWDTTPGYEWRVEQGNDSINALAGARGGLVSGRTLQELARFNQGIASEEFNNVASRIGGLVDTGMSAAQMSGQASQNAAAGVSNALAGIGNARAAGAIGTGNAISGAINNGIGIWQYQRGLQQPMQPANALNPFNAATGAGNWWQGTA